MTATIKVESPRFGTLEIDPDKVIEFPRGLPGFESCHRFALLNPADESPKYFILQSLDEPDVAFHISDPSNFGFTYEIMLSDEDVADLKVTDVAETAVVVMLSKAKDDAPVSANLKCPLVLNLNQRRGLQHVFANLKYTVSLKGE